MSALVTISDLHLRLRDVDVERLPTGELAECPKWFALVLAEKLADHALSHE